MSSNVVNMFPLPQLKLSFICTALCIPRFTHCVRLGSRNRRFCALSAPPA
ncbi:hypothetical protein T12_15736 [Trichinella patagoniensis]|uniref:Uncharacterized protein n=1 Tax=Trichinella patagoniensis TaxID=990121 RepID=A0A0V0Z2L8_9BILA|nr:hypothetical protein T12_15736 [Trichinella patagoniensis]